ncbi:MAG TPA: serine/threonine-protein kinase [Planctomycetota bacterium]
MTAQPHEDWLATEFLVRLRSDEQRGARRPLREYLAEYPGSEEIVAREFVLATAVAGAERQPACAADPEAAVGPAQIGPFRLLHELGRGSQGAVHLAEDTRLQRLVALKVLIEDDPTTRLHMLREATAAARLQHAGIAALLEAGESDGRPWLAMQYVPGSSLRERLQQGPLGQVEAVDIVRRLCTALHTAHERGLVHRDIKPSNVLLGAEGPVLLDFGLAHDERGHLPTVTRGDACGTPDYMSPEQLTPAHRIDRRADVWALGVVLYECLTGVLPFRAPSREGVCHAVLQQELSLPRRLPRALRAVVTTALQRDARRRYATAAAFAEDLQRFQAGEPVAALLPGRVERTMRWLRRHAVLSAVAATTAIALVAGLALSMSFWRTESHLRRRAETAFADVRELARTLAFDVHDALRGIAGATKARHLVHARAMALFERLVRESEFDPGLENELVASLTKLGDVLGHDGTDNLGDLDAARECYARAAGIAARRLQRGVVDPEEAATLLTARLKDADLRCFVDAKAAAAAYGEALRDLATARARWPASRRLRSVEACALLNRGSLAQAMGENDAATSFLAAALAGVRGLTADPDGARAHGEQLVTTMTAYGRAQFRSGRRPEGIATLRETVATAADARFEVSASARATACLFLGTILLAGEEHEEGAALLETVIDIRTAVRAANPEDVSATLRLASVHFERACLMPELAAADLEAARVLCDEVRVLHPEHAGAQVQTARLHLLAAQLASDTALARSHLAEAESVVALLASRAPAHADLPAIEQWLQQVRRSLADR